MNEFAFMFQLETLKRMEVNKSFAIRKYYKILKFYDLNINLCIKDYLLEFTFVYQTKTNEKELKQYS